MAALCAKRHADAKLVRPLRNRIRHHAIKTHCRERQRQHGERSKDPRDKVLLLVLLLIADPMFQVIDLSIDLLVGIDRIHLRRYRM